MNDQQQFQISISMPDPRKIAIRDFTYELPDERIALHPLPQRDASKLLIYKEGKIAEDTYSNIASHLPAGSLLVFNNTKVINARLRFKKSSGGIIEIFCLEPYEKINEYSSVMNKQGSSTWKCFIGGAAKWKEGALEKEVNINNEAVKIKAVLNEKLSDGFVIGFSWFPEHLSFAEVIETAGDIPLPPYIKRNTDADDLQRYQTIYAKHDGSVAAPTAGLHFTQQIFDQLSAKKIEKEYITLHVGAGTFKPVKAEQMEQHEMHAEWIDVSHQSILNILNKKNDIVAVGTTSARTLETLYWLGVKAFLHPQLTTLELTQWEVYESSLATCDISSEAALQALLNWMESNNKMAIFTQTQLLITPGYRFRIIKAIITNFHQPQSTLLLLVAAATKGEWRKIYAYALENNFRFLSYGDGNLIFI
jgi:S-adenosylmethionine:tRNA ribosyltransferase-isomerase